MSSQVGLNITAELLPARLTGRVTTRELGYAAVRREAAASSTQPGSGLRQPGRGK